MLRNLKSLFGFHILAEDGEIGKVNDIYFSDDTWTIRYLVVDTGPWIFGRKVLIAVNALGTPDWEAEKFPVSLTREQVKNSPEMDTEKPVSRHQEIELHSYYRWNGYWTVQPGFNSELKPPGPTYPEIPAPVENITPEQGDPHLQSAKSIVGAHVKAKDSSAGQVEDFLVDDETWFIRFVIVNTGDLLPGKKILIAPLWIEAVRPKESEIYIPINSEQIKASPEYDPAGPLAKEYLDQLEGHYDRTKFWRQSS